MEESMADAKKDDVSKSLNDISDFMQKMWNPFGVPMPGLGIPGSPIGAPGAAPMAGMPGGVTFPNPAAMFATIDPAELGRKIDEMRVIEGWLQMSLNMMQLSIKTMELQKTSLEALRSAHAPGSEKSPSGNRKA
jgi:hypothetical protein